MNDAIEPVIYTATPVQEWVLTPSNRPMNDEPLIHTTAGNVPVSSLVYATHWEATADYVKFIETYTLEGLVVRQYSIVNPDKLASIGRSIELV